jgi:hypothetical protein
LEGRNVKTFILASALIMCATAALAQSLPNYGPNPPSGADSFGQPPSGYLPPGVSRYGPPRAYAPPPNHRYTRRYHRKPVYY